MNITCSITFRSIEITWVSFIRSWVHWLIIHNRGLGYPWNLSSVLERETDPKNSLMNLMGLNLED